VTSATLISFDHHQLINDRAQAYKGIIPADRWTEPYMSREKLQDDRNPQLAAPHGMIGEA
jgi:hypothetical protein